MLLSPLSLLARAQFWQSLKRKPYGQWSFTQKNILAEPNMNVWPYSQGMILDHDTLQGLRTNNPEASCLMFYAVCNFGTGSRDDMCQHDLHALPLGSAQPKGKALNACQHCMPNCTASPVSTSDHWCCPARKLL